MVRMGEKGNVWVILVLKFEGEHFEDLGLNGEIIFKSDLRSFGWDSCHLA